MYKFYTSCAFCGCDSGSKLLYLYIERAIVKSGMRPNPSIEVVPTKLANIAAISVCDVTAKEHQYLNPCHARVVNPH